MIRDFNGQGFSPAKRGSDKGMEFGPGWISLFKERDGLFMLRKGDKGDLDLEPRFF
jgi:hypothetical protein